jgi:hypothetical protein
MRKAIGLLVLGLLGVLSAQADTDLDAKVWAESSSNLFGWVDVEAQAVTLDHVQSAVESVLSEMGYVRTENRRKEKEAVLVFRGANDQKIAVKLKQFDDYTNIKIKVGWAGNGGLSRLILQNVYPKL